MELEGWINREPSHNSENSEIRDSQKQQMHGWQAQKKKNLVPKSQETLFKGSTEALQSRGCQHRHWRRSHQTDKTFQSLPSSHHN